MSDERSRGIPDSVKGWAILLIAFGVFAAGIGNGYAAISKKIESNRKIASDRVKAEEERRIADRQKEAAEIIKQFDIEKAKDVAAETPKIWRELRWAKDRKAKITTRYRRLNCNVKATLDNFGRGEYLYEISLLDKDGFRIGRAVMGPYASEEIVSMSLDDYNRIASVTAKAYLR